VSDVAASPGATFFHSPGGAPGASPGPQRTDTGEACPLCGHPLRAEQEWCLHCGAAARTRLAATPNWRAPIVAIVAVVALSLGVLTAALVDLAGSSSPTRIEVTRIVTTAPAATVPAPATPATTTATTTTTPAPAAPATAAPGTSTTGPKTTTTTTPSKRTIPPAAVGTSTGSIIPGVTQPGTNLPPSQK
jgi:hypothetical protein